MQSATDPTNLRVDEDGFVALVAPDAYSGFVDEDWELEDLLARFVEQMNCEVLFIAYPGPDDANAALELSPQAPSAMRRQAIRISAAERMIIPSMEASTILVSCGEWG